MNGKELMLEPLSSDEEQDSGKKTHFNPLNTPIPHRSPVPRPPQPVQLPVVDLRRNRDFKVKTLGVHGEEIELFYRLQLAPIHPGGPLDWMPFRLPPPSWTEPRGPPFIHKTRPIFRPPYVPPQPTPVIQPPQPVRPMPRPDVSIGGRPGSSTNHQVSVQEQEKTQEDEATESDWKHIARQYQLDLYQAARRRNIIAFLDTGAGKTFISVLLIRDIAARAERFAKMENVPKKPIFFLVPSKVLVQQQAEVLRKHTDLQISQHTGDRKNEDVWDGTTWNAYVQEAHVLVMTPQILLNMLRKQ